MKRAVRALFIKFSVSLSQMTVVAGAFGTSLNNTHENSYADFIIVRAFPPAVQSHRYGVPLALRRPKGAIEAAARVVKQRTENTSKELLAQCRPPLIQLRCMSKQPSKLPHENL